jgi:hypothetical protein
LLPETYLKLMEELRLIAIAIGRTI